MYLFEVIRALLLVLPFAIFTTFGVFILLTGTMNARRVALLLRRLLGCYFVCTVTAGAGLLAYYYFREAFARLDVVYGGAVLFSTVLFHHFLCYAISPERRFGRLHYVISLFTTGGLCAVKGFLPGYWVREGTAWLFGVMLGFAAVYAGLSLLEIHRFHIRQAVRRGVAETINRPMVAFYLLEVLAFAAVFGLLPLVGGADPDVGVSLLLMLSVLAALLMNIPFTYAVIRHYRSGNESSSLFESFAQPPAAGSLTERHNNSTTLDSEPKTAKRVYRNYTRKHHSTGRLIEIDKAEFEGYFRKHKPYLNPNLTIGDLVEPLHSNRTYISKFVNRVHGVNFNTYINLCRLSELERLMAAPGNRHKSPAALCLQAGFGNYRNYMNVKKRFEANEKAPTE